MKHTHTALIALILLSACTSAPTVTAFPTATVTVLPTSTSLPTSTPTLTATQAPLPTATKTIAPTATPTPEIKAPQYTITKYYVNTNFDDGTLKDFAEWTQNGQKRWMGDTSYRQIIDDPTSAGKGKVVAFYAKGKGLAFDNKHRLSITVDETAPGMSGLKFNPGAWGASMSFFFEPNHDPFTKRSDSRNLTIFEVFDAYEQDNRGNVLDQHIAVKLHMETNGTDNVITLYETDTDGTNLIKLAQSKIPIKDGVWNNIHPMVSDDGKFYLFNGEKIDPDLNGVKLPHLRRVGVATASYGTYAGVDFVQSKGLTMYVDDVQLYLTSITK